MLRSFRYQWALGVNMAGMEFAGTTIPGTPNVTFPVLSPAQLTYYNSKGWKRIRLPFRWARLQPVLRAPLDETHLGFITPLIDEAQALGMTILLDVHDFGGRSGPKIGSVGGPTVDDFADFWSRLSFALLGRRGPHLEFDIMNEPSNMPAPEVWPATAQAVVDAIREHDRRTLLYIEGDGFSSAGQWLELNENLDIDDRFNRLVYSAHSYLDRDNSGTHSIWADEVAAGVTVETGIQRVRVFAQWCKERGHRGHIGEMGAGNDDQGWLQSLKNSIELMRDNSIMLTYWAAGPWWGDYPYNVENWEVGLKIAGRDQKQTAVTTLFSGIGHPTVYFLTGPIRGNPGEDSQPFTIEYRGLLRRHVNITLSDGGAGGTFTPSSVQLRMGFNPSVTFTYRNDAEDTFALSVTNNWTLTDPPTAGFTTQEDMFVLHGVEPRNCISPFLLYAPYIGPCLRLRRASDNAEMDFDFESSLVGSAVDVDAITVWAAGSNVHVVRYYDQSQNAWDLGPVISDNTGGGDAVNADQPQLILDGQNGLPVARFDNDRMDMKSPIHGLTEQTLMLVVGRILNYGLGLNWTFVDQCQFPNTQGNWDTTYDIPADSQMGLKAGWHTYHGTWKGGDAKRVYRDGVLLHTTPTAASIIFQHRDVAQFGWFRFGTGSKWRGDLAELIVFADALDDTAREAFEADQQSRWDTGTTTPPAPPAPPDPDFTLDYADTMALVGGETFQRSDGQTCATYWDVNGVLQTVAANVARFDHDPKTHEPLGVLIEPSRRRLTLYANDYTQSWWTKTNVTLGSGLAGPDGVAGSWRNIVASATGGEHVIASSNMTIVATQTVCIPVVVKKQGYPCVRIRVESDAHYSENWFDLDRLIFSRDVSFGWETTDRWFRELSDGVQIWVVVETFATTTVRVLVGGCPSFKTASFTGDGTSGVYCFHVGCEVGTHVCPSLIVGENATPLRNVDLLRQDMVSAIPSWDATRGSIVAKYAYLTANETKYVAALGTNNVAADGLIGLQFGSSGGTTCLLRDGLSHPGSTPLSSINSDNRYPCINRIGVSYQDSEQHFSLNSDTSDDANIYTPPSTGLKTLFVGHQASNGTHTNTIAGWIQRIDIWTDPLTADDLTQLTEFDYGGIASEYALGVNIAGLGFNGLVVPGVLGQNYFDTREYEFEYFHSRGVDLVRLSVLWERCQQAIQTPLIEGYVNHIDQALAFAAARNMLVVIDVHNFGEYYGHRVGDGVVSAADFADLWGRLATRFVGRPGLGGYDLMNEPTSFGPDHWSYIEYVQAAIDAIRLVDMGTPIHVAGVDNGSSARLWGGNNRYFRQFHDPANKIVFHAHSYWDSNGSGTYSGTYESTTETVRTGSRHLVSFAHWLAGNGKAGFIGEYGTPVQLEWLDSVDGFMKGCKKYGIPGTWWSGGRAWNSTYPLLIEGLNINLVPQNFGDRQQMQVLLENPPD